MATRATTNIKIPHYRILYRAAASYTKPTTAADWSTFLATFTELGYCEKGLKWESKPGDNIELDDGSIHVLGFNGRLEGNLLQTSETDYDEIAGIEGSSQDFLFVDEDLNRAVVVLAAKMYLDVEIISGETEKIPFHAEFTNKSRSAMYDKFDIPMT